MDWGTAAGLFLVIAAVAAMGAWLLRRRLVQLEQTIDAFASGRREPTGLIPSRNVFLRGLEQSIHRLAHAFHERLGEAQRERTLLEATLSSMHEGIMVLDSRGEIILCNEQAQRCFGGNVPLTGRGLVEVVRQPEIVELFRRVSESEIAAEQEVLLADHRTLRVRVSPIREGRDRAPLLVVVAHDVTETRRLEATRRDFVANVSHELRTPLTAIRGYAETLLAGALSDPERARKFVAVIERHAERLARLVDDLLALSNLELGRTPLRLGPVHLATVVHRATEALGPLAESAQVRLVVQCPPDLPALLGDPDRVEQVVLNLTENAIKFTPAGGTVTVSARVAERAEGTHLRAPKAEGPWVELRVEDTGIGIPSRDLPRLTERFYRVDRARSRELGGTGLGLAIVKHIVQAHGGALRIESELGHGTCVCVYFPLASQPAPTTEDRAREDAART